MCRVLLWHLITIQQHGNGSKALHLRKYHLRCAFFLVEFACAPYLLALAYIAQTLPNVRLQQISLVWAQPTQPQLQKLIAVASATPQRSWVVRHDAKATTELATQRRDSNTRTHSNCCVCFMLMLNSLPTSFIVFKGILTLRLKWCVFLCVGVCLCYWRFRGTVSLPMKCD